MKKLIFVIAMLWLTSPVWAELSLDPLLNKVTLQMQAQDWVTTQTALVSVNVNAAVADQNIANVQATVMQKLKQFAPGDWHITSFNRQQDQSGLESLQITAEARLPQANLNSLRDKAKAMSKPGETYTIAEVAFTPSDDETRQAQVLLRNNIYQQVKNEIDALNRTYPDQKYYLHQINFNGNQPMPMHKMYMREGVAAAPAMASASQAAPLDVGNKVTLQAMVTLASMSSVPSTPLVNATH